MEAYLRRLNINQDSPGVHQHDIAGSCQVQGLREKGVERAGLLSDTSSATIQNIAEASLPKCELFRHCVLLQFFPFSYQNDSYPSQPKTHPLPQVQKPRRAKFGLKLVEIDRKLVKPVRHPHKFFPSFPLRNGPKPLRNFLQNE